MGSDIRPLKKDFKGNRTLIFSAFTFEWNLWQIDSLAGVKRNKYVHDFISLFSF